MTSRWRHIQDGLIAEPALALLARYSTLYVASEEQLSNLLHEFMVKESQKRLRGKEQPGKQASRLTFLEGADHRVSISPHKKKKKNWSSADQLVARTTNFENDY